MDILLLVIGVMNFIFLWCVYAIVSERLRKLENTKQLSTIEYKRLTSQPKYNESVDPMEPDGETRDFLVRMYKEERVNG